MSENPPVIEGQFKIERDGEISYLAYETDGHEWISLLHTEVAPKLRGRGIAGELSKMALEYAKEHHLKVEIICPTVAHFVGKHPEYGSLVSHRG